MLYKCKICDKEFNKKCHYENHLNRINPCMKKPKIIHGNPLNLHVLPQKAENKCSYCYKTYSRSDVLKNHLLICKII